MIRIYIPGPTLTYVDVKVDDNSKLYQELPGTDDMTLNFTYPTHIEIPVGAYVEWKGVRYTTAQPCTFTQHSSIRYDYTVILKAPYAAAQKYILRSPQGLVSFGLHMHPVDFARYIVQELNARPNESGWQVGTVLEGESKTVSFNNNYIFSAAGMIADAFETEFFFENKTFHLGKIQYNKSSPIPLETGKGLGLRPGTGRLNSDDSNAFEILYVQGGEQNIDAHLYGNTHLLLPKNKTIQYEEKTYKTSSNGLFLQVGGELTTYQEASLDLSEYYPKREGTVTGVEVINAEKHLWDVFDTTIPEGLDYAQYLIPGITATIIFQTGMLAGREFDVNYKHADRRWEIVPADIEGQVMPNETYPPRVNDKYIIFNTALPAEYTADDASRTGASWDMLRDAARYMYENGEPRYSYTGQPWTPWVHANWTQYGSRFKLAGSVLLKSSQWLPSSGALLRITSLTTSINNPYDIHLTISNTPSGTSFSVRQHIQNTEEVLLKEQERYFKSLVNRQYRSLVETAELLVEAGLSNFTDSISPITIQSMQLLIGDPSLQFVFVNNKEQAQVVPHLMYFDTDENVFVADAGWIQHKTIGITTVQPSRDKEDYKYWQLPAFTSTVLVDETPYYLYIKAAKSTEQAEFLLSTTPIGLEEVPEYYHFLTGILNSKMNEQRSFAKMYGFSAIEPGRLLIDVIQSTDFDYATLQGMMIDLANKKVIMGAGAEFITSTLKFSRPEGAPFDAKQYVELLTTALEESTEIQGGLILASAMALRYRDIEGNYHISAGMSGDAVDPTSIALWMGGLPIDKGYGKTGGTIIEDPTGAKGVDRHDGTGYRADGNLWWDKDGNLFAKLNGLLLSLGDGTMDGSEIIKLLTDFKDAFTIYRTETGELEKIQAMEGLYTNSYLSANGLDPNSGGGGGEMTPATEEDIDLLFPFTPEETSKYITLPYLEFSGLQYINLGISPRDNIKVTIRVRGNYIATMTFIGAIAADDRQIRITAMSSVGPQGEDVFEGWQLAYATETQTANSVPLGNQTDIYLSKTGSFVGRQQLSPFISSLDNTFSSPLFLGALNNKGTAQDFYVGRGWELRIEIGNTIMELLPAISKETQHLNQKGYYDLVSKQFFASDGAPF